MWFLKAFESPLARRLIVAVLVALARELADWHRPRGRRHPNPYRAPRDEPWEPSLFQEVQDDERD